MTCVYHVRHEVYDECGKVVYSKKENGARRINNVREDIERQWHVTAGDRLYKWHQMGNGYVVVCGYVVYIVCTCVV